MNRRQTLSTLSGLAAAAVPVLLARNVLAKPRDQWTLLTSLTLKPGAKFIRLPVEHGQTLLHGLRFGVDGNPLMIRKALLHRGPRNLTSIDVNEELMPGHRTRAIFPKDGPLLVRAISLEYEALAGTASQTVMHVWIST